MGSLLLSYGGIGGDEDGNRWETSWEGRICRRREDLTGDGGGDRRQDVAPGSGEVSGVNGVGSIVGTTEQLCSLLHSFGLHYMTHSRVRGNAMTMKRMLETSFPGINVFLHNYPPAFPKRVLSKIMPVIQVGAIATIMAGDQIFPRLGITPPPLFYSLRANRFGTMATIWLIGNFAQSFLQSSGAFEVYCNGDLVFSKLAEQRFPSEFELRDLIGSRLPPSPFGKNMGNVLS
uniref:SelT-like protein n=1 Tax=Aegilops tauschii TaxID=37682 RepID=N1QRE2_AEGTA